MENYKDEIQKTRVGCVGSSDARILAQIASLESVPKSAYKRLAVVKGLIPHTEIPKTAAIKAGDEMEMLIYNYMKSQDPRYESNPLWVSKKYSRSNVKLISHPDLVLVDGGTKTINVYEVKTTKYNVDATRKTYIDQLYVHNVIGKEKAAEFGKDWNVRVFLVHYDTDGLDLTQGVEFDESRLSVHRIRFSSACFDVDKAMTIVNDFLETFTEYYDGEEIDANLLPSTVKTQFDDVAAMLVEIKERETKVEEFKKRLYDFMVEKNIKSIKNDVFTISCVAPTVSKSFDAKRYVEDLVKQFPRKSKKIIAKYTKETKRKGYAVIKIK